MDTLRFIPESLSAARTNLQHVVRELIGGKVEISYVRAADRTTITSFSTPTPTMSQAHTRTPDPSLPNDKMPSPWGFVTSGYALGLLLMAILLNRISNVVVPPRQARRTRRRIWHAILPINISATHTRLISRVPSIVLLGMALFLLSISLVQSAEIWEPLAVTESRWSGMWYVRACRWAAGKEMAYVCWWTYIAVCVAMVMNTLTRGLEGAASDGPQSFNLFGYSFLLHIYASPIMHSQVPKQPLPTEYTPPSRPDKHVLLTIILPLLQLTILHVLAINKRWSRQRLIPTTVCGLLSLAHFVYVSIFSSSSYPFFTYLNSLLEAFLVGIIVLTCILHCLTRALLSGQFTLNPFADDGLGHASLLPNRSDDYAVALLKLGSACIELTAMAGFGNEVSPIHTPDTLYITHTGVPSVPVIAGAPRGLAREIKSVHAVEPDLGSSAWIDTRWTGEIGRFGQRIAHVGRGVWSVIWRGRRRCENEHEGGHAQPLVVRPRSEAQDVSEVYARYLLGQATLSDDEDDEFRFEEVESDSGSESEGESESATDEEDSAPTLYADLARRSLAPRSRSSSPSALTPMLIAHLTSPARSPLTRRKYTQISRPEPDLGWVTPKPKTAIEDEDDPRRNCVVCTVEPRSVICWPCRCLALCDDCRSNLASRMGAGKHQCPCCRRNVEGYSRIFIP